jgi:hypothetical protein
MATSAIALFGVLTSKAKGEPLPPGVAYAADGSGFTTDAAEALEGGAIATFGGHKGTGLALMVELLAGVLPGGAVLGQCESKKTAKSWGHTLIAIDPAALVDDFDAKAASVMETVKASAPAGAIRLPGESSARIAAERAGAPRRRRRRPVAARVAARAAASAWPRPPVASPSARCCATRRRPSALALPRSRLAAAGTMPIPKKIWESICLTAEEGLPK